MRWRCVHGVRRSIACPAGPVDRVRRRRHWCAGDRGARTVNFERTDAFRSPTRKARIMTNKRLVLCVLLGALTGVAWPARGQGWSAPVHGMFGDRVLGGTLSPQPGAHRGGIVTGPAGVFLGRGRSEGLQFPNMPWQYPVAAEPRGGGRYGPSEPRPAERWQPPVPPSPPGPVPGEEAAPPPPAQWFGAPATEAANTRARPSVSAGIATAAASPIRLTSIGLELDSPTHAGNPAAVVADVIRRNTRIQRLSPITVRLERETAILRGRVATEHDRQLVELLTRFEPGIWRVQNEVTVGEREQVAVGRPKGL